MSKYGNIKKAYKIYPDLNNYTLTCSENEITAEFPEGTCAMFVKIEFETGKLIKNKRKYEVKVYKNVVECVKRDVVNLG